MTSCSESALRVLIADDHPVLLGGIRELFNGVDDMTVVGEAGTGRQALRLISEIRPDVAVVDVSMPEMHGIAVVEQLAADASPTRVVILSFYEDRSYVRQALAAGAHGYVLKRSIGQDLLRAIRAVSVGEFYLDRCLAERTVPTGDPMMAGLAGRTGKAPLPLTEREREVIRQVAFGFTNKEIAAKLGVTSKSIETYKMRAIEKLDTRSRAKIVQYAMMQGWFDHLPQ